jgi:excisionase family DNA binding protein
MEEGIQMLNPRQVAEILGVHQKTVHLWLRSGKLQGIKISYRAWRIPQSSLDSFIAGNSNMRLKQQPGQPQKAGTESISSFRSRKEQEETIEEKGIRDISPQLKMKHYIRDIMGEQTHEE